MTQNKGSEGTVYSIATRPVSKQRELKVPEIVYLLQ